MIQRSASGASACSTRSIVAVAKSIHFLPYLNPSIHRLAANRRKCTVSIFCERAISYRAGPSRCRMQSAKEKVKEFSGKAEGKAEAATARTPEESAAAEERAKAREKEAKAAYHEGKAEHREQVAADRGTTHVPLTGQHHHHTVVTDPTYPAGGEKYV